jgi:polar amino acid transport system substrate-binding protein
MTVARARRPVLAGIALLVVALAGCSSADPPLGRPSVPVPAPRPDGVTERPKIPAGDDDPGSCNPRASYRPVEPSQGGATLAAIRARGLLRVGGQQTYFLLSYRDPVTGEMSGFEVDLARLIAGELLGDPGRVQFVALTVAEREPALQSGKVDIVLASMAMTCERWESVAFSTEYLASGRRVLVNRKSGITGMDDLGGRKVCASGGGTNIADIARTPSGPIPVAAKNATDCLVLLQQGQVDAVSTGEMTLAGLAAQDRASHIVGPRLDDSPVGAAMHRDAVDLVRFVNGVLERVRSTGEWDRLYRTWFLPELEPATAPPAVYRD